MLRVSDELVRRIFVTVSAGAIEVLLVGYIAAKPEVMLKTLVLTIGAILLGAAGENIRDYGTSPEDRLRTQMWAFLCFFITALFFGTIVAVSAKRGVSDPEFPIVEGGVVLVMAVITFGFPSFVRSLGEGSSE